MRAYSTTPVHEDHGGVDSAGGDVNATVADDVDDGVDGDDVNATVVDVGADDGYGAAIYHGS